MTRPVATITQIDNGYLVTTVGDKIMRTQEGAQQEQIVKFCADYSEVCSALKGEFPPTHLSRS